jgi:hypothetical protein
MYHTWCQAKALEKSMFPWTELVILIIGTAIDKNTTRAQQQTNGAFNPVRADIKSTTSL